jgi:hypothetical protein
MSGENAFTSGTEEKRRNEKTMTLNLERTHLECSMDRDEGTSEID